MIRIHMLKEYLVILQEQGLVADYDLQGREQAEVSGVTFNSKEVSDGTLFVCKGAAFKEQYLEDSLGKGAIAYVSETRYTDKAPYIVVTDVRKAMPFLGNLCYDHPAEKLKLTGITGTKGKSTTVYYLKAIVDDYLESLNGKESGVVSTIDTYDGYVRKESRLTTPESLVLLSYLAHMAETGLGFAEIEVSAQALKYDRVDGIPFSIGIFLNISEDHISPIEHPDMDDYLDSKLLLFRQSDIACICVDSDYYERVEKAAAQAKRVVTFGRSAGADYYGYDIRKEGREIHFRCKCADFDEEFVLTMPGLFNVENALAAITAANLYGIPVEYIKSGLFRARSRGRMEQFASIDGKVIAIVDYAHNKLSFEELFTSIRKEYPDYQISIVFGCPGRKAVIRREQLGTLAGQLADHVYICAEDPATERYEDIAEEVAGYVKKYGCPYVKIENRGEAAKQAIEDAEKRDEKTVVLITGKGNESRQMYGLEYIDCPSDLDNAKRYIGEYNGRHPL